MPIRLACYEWVLRLTLGCLLAVGLPATGYCQADGGDDESAIPAGLLQNRHAMPELEITKELLTDGEEAEFKKKGGETALQKAFGSASPNEEEKKALDNGARWFVYRLTMVKYREEETPNKDKNASAAVKNSTPKERLPEIRTRVLNTLRTYATKPSSAVAREYFLKKLTEHCEELLDNNFHVRLNAVLLLGQISLNDGNLARGLEPPAFAGAYPVLLEVVQDTKQHEAIRVAAALALTRICRTALTPDLADKRRVEIAVAVAAVLAKNNTHWWLQMRLAECLAAAGVAGDPADKNNPAVLQTLAEVMSDKQRHWEVRVEAARAIGRLPLDGITVGPIAYEMVNLGHQLAQGYMANPKKESWTKYFWKLYLAFKKSDSNDKVVGDRRKAGLLEAIPGQKEIKDAYEQIVIITNVGLDPVGKLFSAEQLKTLEVWLKDHKSGSIMAGGVPISKPSAPKKGNGDESTPSGP